MAVSTQQPSRTRAWGQILFGVMALASLAPGVTAGLALVAGSFWGLTIGDPFGGASEKLGQRLLKACVVGLGFGLPMSAILHVGRSAVVITGLGIVSTLYVGYRVGTCLRVDRSTSTLISGGTAICGGSAVAALGSATGATGSSMGVALATVFLLNSVGLLIFPFLGHQFSLSQDQFGFWAAMAIHDTSAVVGAAGAYGGRALEIATIMKLTRALWIIPVTLGIATWSRRRTGGSQGSVSVPWFIVLFVAASALRMAMPGGEEVFDYLSEGAKRGLVMTLFFIGAGLTRTRLRAAGMRPLLQGLIVWCVVAVVSLLAVSWWIPGTQ